MTNTEWVQSKIDEWEQAQKKAAEEGNYEAWEWAERELNNYKQMLEVCKKW